MINVNRAPIDETSIVKEMQYHDSATHTESKNKASEVLIIAELLKQRAIELGLADKGVDITSESGSDFLEILIEKEVKIPKATETDCRYYFDNNSTKFITSPLVAVRHILLAAVPDDAELRSNLLDQASVLVERLEPSLALFSALAKMHSACSSAGVGGELGQLSKGQTVPEFERQVFNCPVGLVRSPIETRYGIHIVVVDERVEGKELPYNAVKTRISNYLNEKVRRKSIAQYIQTLVVNADIDGFDLAVSESPLLQ